VCNSPEQPCNNLGGSEVGLLACNTPIIAPPIEPALQYSGLAGKFELYAKSIVIKDPVFLFLSTVFNYFVNSNVGELLRAPFSCRSSPFGCGVGLTAISLRVTLTPNNVLHIGSF
jgi:hypothetical protein